MNIFIRSRHSIKRKDKNNFKKEVIDRMIKLTIKNDGRCFETFRRINVYAKK